MQDFFNNLKAKQKKALVMLVDPDKPHEASFYIDAKSKGIDMIFVGGSIVFNSVKDTIRLIKKHTNLPVIIFPGSVHQLCEEADGVLFTSLISGRNPDLLIGNQVVAAPFVKKSGMHVFPTGYILINTGRTTSVEYMSNTKAIPDNKPDIAVATAMAGELLGMQLIYMDGGSGGDHCIPAQVIREVRKNMDLPLIVGGGIRSAKDLKMVYQAGADVAVVGNAFETKPSLLDEFKEVKNNY